MNSIQMTPVALAAVIEQLPAETPIAERFERELVRLGTSDRGRRWYTTQKQHWLGWLSEYSGPGAYGRTTSTAKATAQTVYNRIGNPAMLMWLAEAAGVASEAVEAAMQAALAGRTVYSAQCAAIRKVIPWSLVSRSLATSLRS